ncbi:MAG: exosortase B [Rubrivivax sp.]|nr:exosortase B [Rubrivivax sp.]
MAWLAAPLVLGGLAMYVPTLVDLFRGYWMSDDNAHGPIVLAISVWLLYRKWAELNPPMLDASAPRAWGGWALVASALLLYVFGRSQQIIQAEAFSAIPLLMGFTVLLWGRAVLGKAWFAFFFMFFMIPLPGTVVDPVTLPMKTAVSYMAEQIMYAAGYPVARVGVILYVGQYQMLVADACAGLRTLFTLEALGLLYLNLVRYQSIGRNVGLALLIIPISMSANVIRVIVLCLVTLYLGDEAGQGFLHGFAGFVLFFSALALTLAADSLLRLLFSRRKPQGA